MVNAFDALQEVDHGISNWRHERLVNYFDQVSGDDQVNNDAERARSVKRGKHDHRRIYRLADNRRADRSRPKKPPFGEQLELRHREGIGKLATPVGQQACRDDAAHRFENRFERLLILELGRRWNHHGNIAERNQDERREEPIPDSSARRTVAVNFSEDVPEDISQWKQNLGAADTQRAKREELWGNYIRHQEHRDKQSDQSIEIFVTMVVRQQSDDAAGRG